MTQDQIANQGQVLDEVEEIIKLPKFEARSSGKHQGIGSKLRREVVEQLRLYVKTVAAMYRDNPFHNFEHASHVTMSVVKLLSRIVAPDIEHTDGKNVASRLHDHTYGITSDQLTQFAVVFSALIHDLDHPGVPNAQLVKEGTHIAGMHKNKSVAEQNSVDIAWNLLNDDGFKELRYTIYASTQELDRFRQLVVNTVMATDIMDKDLGALRKGAMEHGVPGAPK